MNKFKIILSMATAVFCFTAVHAQKQKATFKNAPVNTVVYECPMKCAGNKAYTKAGKCPVCNMNLKAMAKPPAAFYQCPMRCEGDKTYNKQGKCPKCNMDLGNVVIKKEVHGHEGHDHN